MLFSIAFLVMFEWDQKAQTSANFETGSLYVFCKDQIPPCLCLSWEYSPGKIK